MKMKRVLALVLAGIMLLGAAGVAALAADSNEQGITVLQSDRNTLTVDADTLLDLNGYDINELTVNGDGACYVFDSATKEFEDDYGVIKAYTGDVQPFCTPEEDGCGWLMFDNNGADASFHYVVLQVTDMVLQPKADGAETYDPNLYYKCNFKGDEVVAQNVKTFGVALSVVGEPTEENLHTKCGYSVFEDFQSGENGNQNNGTLLTGVMKETNANLINKRNANLEIYGRAYIELENGDYVFGDCRSRTLKKQTQEAYMRWTLLNTGKEEDKAKQTDLVNMTKTYAPITQAWNLPDVSSSWARDVYDAVTWYEEFQDLPVADENMTEEERRQLVVDFFRLQLSFKWVPNATFSCGDAKHRVHLSPGTVYEGLPYCSSPAFYDKNNNKIQDDGELEYSAGEGGNIYKVLNYYNKATGVLDIATMSDKGENPQPVFDNLISYCSGGLIWALGRVSNVRYLHDSSQFVPANGCLPVGPYTWNEYLHSEVRENDGKMEIYADYNDVIDSQDWQLIYQAYAEMKPGDVLACNGHVRMCSAAPEVTYKNGVIDPENSYAWYIDQNSYGSDIRLYDNPDIPDHNEKYSYTQDNGISVHKLGGLVDEEGSIVGNKIRFCDLIGDSGKSSYNWLTGKYTTTTTPDGKRDKNSEGDDKKGYIPVRIAEFCTADEISAHMENAEKLFAGTGRWDEWEKYYKPNYTEVIKECGIETPDVRTTNTLYEKTWLTPEKFNNLSGGSFSANYPISNFRVTVEDKNGNILEEEHPHVFTSNRAHGVKITYLCDASTLLSMETLTSYAGKGNRVKIYTLLSTGEEYLAVNFEIG